jgi:cobalamin biosynthesis protein CobW
VAAGRFADDPEAIARQRANDESLDHDNPLEEVFEDQLLCADLVILNKADLMTGTQRDEVTAEIGKTLPRVVKVVEAQNGQVPIAVLLGLGAGAEADLEGRPSHHELEGEHDHDDFDTFIVELPSYESPQAVIDRLSRATAAHDILRMKGFVDIAGKPMRLLVQGVGTRFQHQYDRRWTTGEARRGRLVVIGEKGLDRAGIEALILD